MESALVVPRPAATVLLLRDGALGLEVFVVVRHKAMSFAPGALVFPGGAVDPEDPEIEASAAMPDTAPSCLWSRAGFRLAAIREAFEEAGLLLARDAVSGRLVEAERLASLAADYREPLCTGRLRFGEMLAAERLVPAIDLLVPFAHWITPFGPKRFDTRFFVAPAPAGQEGFHDGGESIDSLWIAPQAALVAADEGRYKIHLPTRLNIAKVGRHDSVAKALAAARAASVVTVMPEIREGVQGWTARIPAAADYGGELFPIELE